MFNNSSQKVREQILYLEISKILQMIQSVSKKEGTPIHYKLKSIIEYNSFSDYDETLLKAYYLKNKGVTFSNNVVTVLEKMDFTDSRGFVYRLIKNMEKIESKQGFTSYLDFQEYTK